MGLARHAPGSLAVVADNCNCNGPSLNVGGNWNANPNYGPFYLNSNPADNSNANVGARHLVSNTFIWRVFSAPLGENFTDRTWVSRETEPP